MMFYLNTTVFHDASMTNAKGYNDLQALTNSTFSFTSTNLQIDATLLFGDFVHAFLFLKDLMTGGLFADAFGATGILVQAGAVYDGYVSLFVSILFDAASVFLFLYIMSNRSL